MNGDLHQVSVAIGRLQADVQAMLRNQDDIKAKQDVQDTKLDELTALPAK